MNGTAGVVRVVGRLLAGAMVVFLALPLLALILGAAPGDLDRAIARGLGPALTLSLGTTTVTAGLMVALGTPLAWWIARHPGTPSRMVEVLVRLPTVTPPAVAGVALLAAFGRAGLLGGTLVEAGVRLPFSTAAVVMAQLFVAAPFYVLPLTHAFRELDEELLWTARSLGAGPAGVFFRVAIPLASPALLGGLAVGWARALGEFGATLVFAGSLPGVTQTLPIAIYVGMEGDLGPARAMAIVLLAVALGLFFVLRSRPVRRALGHDGP